MNQFGALLDRLGDTPRPDAKRRWLAHYLETTPDPDRGWAVGLLVGAVKLPRLKPKAVRALLDRRIDSTLFGLSYDYARDLAETVALVWPARHGANRAPDLSEIVTGLHGTGAPPTETLRGWLDALDASGRHGLLRMLTGKIATIMTPAEIRAALAAYSGRDMDALLAVWHGAAPPYRSLFAWLDGRDAAPPVSDARRLRPLMSAELLADPARAAGNLGEFLIEWQWEGVRAQLIVSGSETRLYSRAGDDLSARFPEIVSPRPPGVIDGMITGTDSPDALARRMAARTSTDALRRQHPITFRAHDMLVDGDQDIRTLPLAVRRQRLDQWCRRAGVAVSPSLHAADHDTLAALHAGARAQGARGLMIKRLASAYDGASDAWFAWHREPLRAACVLQYVESVPPDGLSVTVGCTDGAGALVPVGKCRLVNGDPILPAITAWAHNHTEDRFGPVRAVKPDMIVDVAFDSIRPSTRHKAGLILQGSSIVALAGDAPPTTLETLRGLIPPVCADAAG